MSTKWNRVCNINDLKQSLGVCALVEGVQVALFKVDRKIYALDNYDPFSQANVISRGIVGDFQGKVVVASPVYKQHFLLETGECLEDDAVILKTYPVDIKNDTILISMTSDSLEVA